MGMLQRVDKRPEVGEVCIHPRFGLSVRAPNVCRDDR